MKKKINNITYAISNQWLWARERVIFTIAKAPITIIMSLLATYFPAMIVSQLENGYKVEKIILTILTYIAVWFVINLIEKYRYSRSEKYRYYISNIYQLKLAEKHWSTDYENTENPNITKEYNLAYDDSMGECAPDEVINTLVDFFISVLGILTFSGVIMSFSVYFIIPVLFSAVVTYITGQYRIKYNEQHWQDSEIFERKMSYISGCEKNTRAAKEIRVFSLASWFDKMFVQNMMECFKISRKNRAVGTKINLINASVLLIQNAIIYTLLTIQIVIGKISASDYIFLLSLVTGFSAWFIGVIDEYNHVISQAIAIQHYRNYLEMHDKMLDSSVDHIKTSYTIPPEITLKNVSYQYNSSDKKLYNDFNIKIGSGEKIAIVGENGAGKTTLIKLICGLYKPQSGEIYIDGEAVSTADVREYFSLFSVVFQDMYLLPIKIKEFVAASDNNISDDKVIIALKKAGLYDKVASLSDGIDTPLMKGVRENGTDLSGGELQKLMIARAYYKDAPILIFDEPTSALDPIAERDLYSFIHNNTADKTVIFISHRLASTKLCDRILFIENGSIVECGSHDELMNKNGKYAELFNIQASYYKMGENNDK